MRVDKCFDASGVRNAHRDYAVPSNGCAVEISTELPSVYRGDARIYCPAVIKRV
jgi:hypothetical protein